MLKIGLTGGIGSGKTTVANLFRRLGFPVYISDVEASRLMNSDKDIIHALKQHVGEDIYYSDGTLNKKKLADLIFTDSDALKKVNSIVHPKVSEDFKIWAEKQHGRMVIFESAIIFESHLENLFDYIICVYADIETRIKRITQRDGIPEEKVWERMRNQMNDLEKCKQSDFIVNTNEGHHPEEQVKHIVSQWVENHPL